MSTWVVLLRIVVSYPHHPALVMRWCAAFLSLVSPEWRRGGIVQKFLTLQPEQGQKHDVHRAPWKLGNFTNSLELGKKKSKKPVNNIFRENRFLYLARLRPDDVNMKVQENG